MLLQDSFFCILAKVEVLMEKHDNFLVNFSLKGITSILIGIYIVIGAYALQFILDGFLTDGNPLGMMSTEIIEIFIEFSPNI